MLMLAAQIAFGFQFHSLFQERLQIADGSIQAAALSGLIAIVLTLGLLIAAPAAHRITEAGQRSERIAELISILARWALMTLAVALACAMFVTITTQFGHRTGARAALLTAAVTVLVWQCWGLVLRRGVRASRRNAAMQKASASLHHRIDYVLTEARVMLPGAQALLGFQLLVPLMQSFETLPDSAQSVHFVALIFVAIAVVLLISPAAIHRIAFQGADDERFLRLASRIVTVTLVPLALGVASELYVAAARLLPGSRAAAWIAAGAGCVLFGLWYAMPLALRAMGTHGDGGLSTARDRS
jgi:small-conductance mechanosensitive channel